MKGIETRDLFSCTTCV